MSASIKAGVIGLGILGREHVLLLDEHEATQVVAVADLRSELAEKTAAMVGAEAYTDYAQMLRNHSLDLVVVATPDWAHQEPSLAAIDAGVPAVFQEKPLATTIGDAEAIHEAVEKKKTRFFINFSNRGTPTFIATHYVLQKGLLGRVVHGEVRLDDNISVPTRLWGGKSGQWAAGSSPIHFLQSHVVDLLRWFLAPGEVKQVYATTKCPVFGHTPELVDAFLCFDNGVMVRVKSEWIKHMEELVEFYVALSGTEGTLMHHRRPGFGAQECWRANLPDKIDYATLIEHQDALRRRGANTAALWLKPTRKIGFLSSGGGQTIPALESREIVESDLKELSRAVIAALLENTDEPSCWRGLGPLPNHVDGLKQTQVCVAMDESGRTRAPVDL